MATLRNKRKLAAVSRETPESTRNSRGQNTLDLESTQDYISQVSEEIEGRVTKKLSKEFSRTESRILGALSKLDEFLLNPQVRTCSVAVPGTSRSNNSENRETTGDRSSDDPCPQVRYSSRHSGHLNSPEAENYPHSGVTSFQLWWAYEQIRSSKSAVEKTASSELDNLSTSFLCNKFILLRFSTLTFLTSCLQRTSSLTIIIIHDKTQQNDPRAAIMAWLWLYFCNDHALIMVWWSCFSNLRTIHQITITWSP